MSSFDEASQAELLSGEFLLLLSNDELVALADLGYGTPVLGPAQGDSEAGKAALVERGFLSADHELDPDFVLVWSLVALPTVLGSVTRMNGDDARSWIYYVNENAFLEQAYEEQGSIFLLGTLLQLPGRVCLNVGLLRDAPEPIDPLEGFPTAGVKFTNLSADHTTSFLGERTAPSIWQVAGAVKSPIEVTDDLQGVIQGAMTFGAGPSIVD